MNFIPYLIVFGLFFVSIILPELPGYFAGGEVFSWLESVKKPYAGVLHVPSAIFIGGATCVLMFFAVISRGSAFASVKPVLKTCRAQRDLLDKFDKLFEHDKHEAYQFLSSAMHENRMITALVNIMRRGGHESDVETAYELAASSAIEKGVLEKQSFDQMAVVLPMLGMVGTIAGLMFMFSAPTSADDFASKFAGLATALLTTLYATLVTVILIKPKSQTIQAQLTQLAFELDRSMARARLAYHGVDMIELNSALMSQSSESSQTQTAHPESEAIHG